MKVFFSYSRNDEEKVNSIKNNLEEQGLKIWLDTHEMDAATEQISKIIHDAINDSALVLIAMSNSTHKSTWVDGELITAKELDKNVITIKLDDCQVPIPLKKNLYDMSSHDDSKFFSLVQKIKSIVRQEYRKINKAPSDNQDILNVLREHTADESIIDNSDFIFKTKEMIFNFAEDSSADCVRLFVKRRHDDVSPIIDTEYNPFELSPPVTLRKQQGIVGWVINSGSLAYEPCKPTDKWKDFYYPSDEKITHEIVVPIFLDSIPIGALLADWIISDDDKMKPWGEQSSGNDIRHKFFNLSKRINKELDKTNKESKHLQEICKECVETTSSERGYIALLTEQGTLDYIPYGLHTKRFLELMPTEGICGEVLRTGKAIDARSLSEQTEAVVSDPHLRSELIIPIKKNNVILGIINVEADKVDIPYTKEDRLFLEESARNVSEFISGNMLNLLTSSSTIFLSDDNPKCDESSILKRLQAYVECLIPNDCSVKIWAATQQDHRNDANWIGILRRDFTFKLKINGRIFAILEIQDDLRRDRFPLNKSDYDHIKLIATLAANATKRYKHRRLHTEFAEFMAKFNDHTLLTESISNPNEFLMEVLTKVKRLIDSSNCTLLWRSAENSTVILPALSTEGLSYEKNFREALIKLHFS